MTVIDDYLSKIEPEKKLQLERIRSIILHTAPDVKEVISYGMPGFKYHGKYLAGFDSFKDHMSFFPTAHPIEVLKDKLQGYKLSKGTIQFDVENPPAGSLIVELIKVRMADID